MKICLTCRLDTKESGAKIDPVHVMGKDLVFTHDRFNSERQSRLKNFPMECPAPQSEAVFGQLLSQSAAPLPNGSGSEVAHGSADYADGVDPEMPHEAGILSGNYRTDKPRTHPIQWHGAPVFAGHAGVDLTMAIDHQ